MSRRKNRTEANRPNTIRYALTRLLSFTRFLLLLVLSFTVLFLPFPPLRFRMCRTHLCFDGEKSIFSLQSSVVQKILQLRTYFLPSCVYFISCSSFSSTFTWDVYECMSVCDYYICIVAYIAAFYGWCVHMYVRACVCVSENAV